MIPPLSLLPRPLALIAAAQLATAHHMIGRDKGAVGVGHDFHTGRALVVDGPSVALDLIEAGDVLVTPATTPSWNVAVVRAGALITTTGGLLSHAAVIARQVGIPALIGDASAARITTGTLVTVDPRSAAVTLPDRPAVPADG